MTTKKLDENNIPTTDTKLDGLLQELWNIDADYIYFLTDQCKHSSVYFWNEPDQSEAFEDGIRFAMQAIKHKRPIYAIRCSAGNKRGSSGIEMFFISEHKELKTLLENTLEEAKEDNA